MSTQTSQRRDCVNATLIASRLVIDPETSGETLFDHDDSGIESDNGSLTISQITSDAFDIMGGY